MFLGQKTKHQFFSFWITNYAINLQLILLRHYIHNFTHISLLRWNKKKRRNEFYFRNLHNISPVWNTTYYREKNIVELECGKNQLSWKSSLAHLYCRGAKWKIGGREKWFFFGTSNKTIETVSKRIYVHICIYVYCGTGKCNTIPHRTVIFLWKKEFVWHVTSVFAIQQQKSFKISTFLSENP